MLKRELLRHEARRWVAEGLLDEAQADRILVRYGTSLADGERRIHRVLSALAGLLAGLAVLLFVSVHWERIPVTLRLLGLIALTFGLNLLGVRRRLAGQGGALVLSLGGLAYGASIMLIGQMYHLGEYYSAGFFLWALGVLLMALPAASVALTLQGLLVALLWSWELAPFAPPWAMPLFLVPALLVARQRHSAVLFLATFFVAGVWLNQMLSWAYATDFGPRWRAGLYPFDLALLLLGLALLRPQLTGAARHTLQGVLARLSLLMLLPATFADTWRRYMEINWGWLDPGLWATLVVSLAVLVLGPGRYRLAVAALAVAMVAVHGWGGPEWALMMAVAGNLTVLVVSLLWLRHGLHEGHGGAFFTGLGGIVLLALLRYVDVIGSDLGGVALFLAMAGVVWGAARYWQTRSGV